VSVVASLLLAQAVSASPPAPQAENEIVVLAQRLAASEVDWSTRLRNGAMTIRRCKVTRSSGDRELDKVVCQSMRECVLHIPTEARQGDALPEFFACTEERSMVLGRELFDRREAAAGRSL
jgi:hypothetical protein